MERVKVVLNILYRETSGKRWRNVNRTTKPPRVQSVLAVKVPTAEGFKEFKTEEGVFLQVSTHLSERF